MPYLRRSSSAPRTLAAVLLALGILSAACGETGSDPSGLKGRAPNPNARPPVVQFGEPPADMPAELRKHWRPVVNPPGTELPDLNAKPIEDRPNIGSGGTAACYPPGHQANPHNDCENPGYLMIDGGGHYTKRLHWGDEPYYGSGARKVWVLDSLSTPRSSEWLQWWVNYMNDLKSKNTGADRPQFIYYTAEQYKLAPGPCHFGPDKHKQWIEFCETTGGPYASWWYGASAHFNFVRAQINVATTNDYYLGYEVVHEGGHGWGAHHNTDCESPMTYCSTVGTKYLYLYRGDDLLVYMGLYDSHL